MKKAWILIALMITFSANSAFALDLSKLCGDFEFMESDVKIYRGNFESGDSKLEHALVVVEVVDSKRAFVLYVHGAQPDLGVKKPDCIPHFGKMKGRKLTINIGSWATVTYKFDKSDSAKVKFIARNNDGSKRTTSGSIKLAEN